MEYSSFCILEEKLYLCTSDLGSLLALLNSKGHDTSKADQGRIYHTNPEDFLVICSLSTGRVVKSFLSEVLNGNLYFKGTDITPNNVKITGVEYLTIHNCFAEEDYAFLVKEIKCSENN